MDKKNNLFNIIMNEIDVINEIQKLINYLVIH